MQIDDLKLLIASKLDVTELLDILQYDMYDLVEVLEEQILEHQEELLQACDEY